MSEQAEPYEDEASWSEDVEEVEAWEAWEAWEDARSLADANDLSVVMAWEDPETGERVEIDLRGVEDYESFLDAIWQTGHVGEEDIATYELTFGPPDEEAGDLNEGTDDEESDDDGGVSEF